MRRLLFLFLALYSPTLLAQSSLEDFIDAYAIQHAFSGTVLVQKAGSYATRRASAW